MPRRTLDVIYADDIRHEIAGKSSYIGVYNSELWVEAFPATLPKLALAVCLRISNDRPIDAFTLRVTRDDDLAYEQEFRDLVAPNEQDFWEQPRPEGIETFIAINAQLIFSPLTLEGPCLLRVRAITSDGEEIKGPSLRIRTPPAAQPPIAAP